MKNIKYLFITLCIVLASCNPLEDVHNEIDSIPEEPNVASFEYTLVDKDYESLDLNFGNFSNVEQAKEKLPNFLATKFPLYGQGSDVNVTFKLYAPRFNEKSLKIYEVTAADYQDNGHTYGNFDSFSDITEFLDVKFPNAANRLLVSLTYKYYNDGTVYDLEDGFIKVNGTWEKSIGISDEEYAAMGEGRAQFSSEDEALVKIPIYLKDKLKYETVEAGDIQGVMYKLYVTDEQDIDEDGKTTDKALYSFVAFFIYDGSSWAKYNNVINSSIKFGHNGTSWVPDNTIRHTLTDANYTYIATTFANEPGYEAPTASVSQYKNFDRRSSNEAYWSDAMLLNAFNSLLNNQVAPNAEEGQQYILIYDIYDGSSGVEEFRLIKSGDAWIVNNQS